MVVVTMVVVAKAMIATADRGVPSEETSEGGEALIAHKVGEEGVL